MKEQILLIGGGGHCRSCIDVILAEGRFEIAGIVDLPQRIGETMLESRFIGSDDDLPALIDRYKNVIITIGQMEDPSKRIEKYQALKSMGARFPVIVSPLAHVSKFATIGEGSIVMHGAMVNPNAVVGKNCIINTKALLEHDVRIGDHCHISTASVLNGQVAVADDVFVGSNSVVVNGVEIGSGVVVGAGSVVTKSLTEGATYAGNPAKRIS